MVSFRRVYDAERDEYVTQTPAKSSFEEPIKNDPVTVIKGGGMTSESKELKSALRKQRIKSGLKRAGSAIKKAAFATARGAISTGKFANKTFDRIQSAANNYGAPRQSQSFGSSMQPMGFYQATPSQSETSMTRKRYRTTYIKKGKSYIKQRKLIRSKTVRESPSRPAPAFGLSDMKTFNVMGSMPGLFDQETRPTRANLRPKRRDQNPYTLFR